jgi:uncharacterized protein YjbI with pentapeptide repeats/fido (protein-threonine AMPylation protein)
MALSFVGQDLTGENFSGRDDLVNADFTATQCLLANFSGSNLSGAIFYGARCGSTVFADCDISQANFQGADCIAANFSNTKVTGTRFRGAHLNETNFQVAVAEPGQGPNFYGADCHSANFTGAKLDSANFYGADCHGATFIDANLDSADCYGADFHGSNADNASFSYGNHYSADFHGSSLVHTDFGGSNNHGADFSGCNLSNSTFTNADVTGADFSGANLTGVSGLPGTGTWTGTGTGAAKPEPAGRQGNPGGGPAKPHTGEILFQAEDRTFLLRAIEVLNEVPVGRWNMEVLIALHRRLLSPTDPSSGQLRTRGGVVRLNHKVVRELLPASASVNIANTALGRLNAVLAGTSEPDWVGVAAETMLNLLEAHPFEDGNGRVSRALATWLLMRGEYELTSDPGGYCRQHTSPYYQALLNAMEKPRPAGGELQRGRCELWDQFFRHMVKACFRAPVGCSGTARQRPGAPAYQGA